MDNESLPQPPRIDAAQLHPPLLRLLRPLVRLLIRAGMTFPALVALLRELHVQVAEQEFALAGKAQTDSRVSLLTGIHRKEVRRLREAGAPVSAVPAAVSLGGQIIGAWLSTPGYVDEAGEPLPLARTAQAPGEPSFEGLVGSVTRDVRARAILDEWLAQGLAQVDAAQRIQLTESAYIPAQGGVELAYYFGRNLHDHMAAASANILSPKPPFMERAVHYDGLDAAQAAHLEQASRQIANAALVRVNKEARRMVTKGPPPPGDEWRWIFGVYVYREKIGKDGEP